MLRHFVSSSNFRLINKLINNPNNAQNNPRISERKMSQKFSTVRFNGNNNNNETDNEETILQYGNLFLVTEPEARKSTFVNSTLFEILKIEAEFNYIKTHGKYKCSDKPLPQEDIEGVLNMIKVPLKIVLNGETWTQGLSYMINDCKDASLLESKLEELLEKRKARLEGICPIRREIYDDCLDEVHRQIALEFPERAILLVRCRKEIEQTIATFAGLYGSIQTYNLRQSILQKNGYRDSHDKLKFVKDEKSQMLSTYDSLQNELRHVNAINEAEDAATHKKMHDELEYFRTEHLRLQNQVNNLLNITKGKKSLSEPAAEKKERKHTNPVDTIISIKAEGFTLYVKHKHSIGRVGTSQSDLAITKENYILFHTDTWPIFTS
ncbi:unnamed protein product [Allacma fusca]|uniref:Uncharacterized protein n=1 Tax=Allacma fusca TaxID=39272 RepID=A0A8J2P9P6_9HEXA|nr:unnamed protein product [Allacma fusca]